MKIANVIPQVQQGMNVCNSFFGRLGSILSGNIAQKCQEVNQAPTLIEYGNLTVFAFGIVGGFCLFFGVTGAIHAIKQGKLELY